MSSLLAKLKKNSTVKMSASMADSKFFNEKDQVKTDLPLLNLALSGSINGGLSSGLTIVAAPSKHFKSNISLFMVSAYMKKYPESVCLFYDSEFGSPPDYLHTFDIDLDRVLHTPIATVEDLRSDLTVQLDGLERGKDKVIIFIDSVGNLASRKETQDALDGKEKADMTRAKTLKSLFRIVTPQFTLKEIPCIVINHTIETLEMFSKTVMTGGCCSLNTEIQTDKGIKFIQDIVPGDKVKTLTGYSEVTHSWNPETLAVGTPECIELTFDDDYKVTVSDNHKFLCSVNDQYVWVEAKDLEPDHDIVSI